MGHYARGDSGKMICSSDEEEGYRSVSRHPSRTSSMMSRMNIRDKRNLILGTFGEAPPVPLPPISDETDRQFWAEDELSSSESRHLMTPRRKRRHSVAYRNRAAVHRSRSGHVQSSSSSTETARINIPPSVRKRRRHRICPGTSRTDRTKIGSSGAQPRINAKTVSRLVSTGNNLALGCELVQPAIQDMRFRTSILPSAANPEVGAARASENTTALNTAAKPDARIARRNRVSKLRPPTKSRRK